MDKSELKVETGRFEIEPYPYWVAVTHVGTQKKAYACGMSQKKAYDECIRDLEGLLKKGPENEK